MAYYEKYSDCPNCGAIATQLTFRNIYQCGKTDCQKVYCDRCCGSNYRCPDCYSDDFEKIGECNVT